MARNTISKAIELNRCKISIENFIFGADSSYRLQKIVVIFFSDSKTSRGEHRRYIIDIDRNYYYRKRKNVLVVCPKRNSWQVSKKYKQIDYDLGVSLKNTISTNATNSIKNLSTLAYFLC